MKWNSCLTRTALTLAILGGATTLDLRANITIEFDYSYDTANFFSGSNLSRRTIMNSVASLFEARLQDTLDAITPGGANTWDAQFYNPATGAVESVTDLTIAANTIKIYAGARVLSGGTLGEGGPGGYSAQGTGGFLNTLATRGEAGAPTTENGLWGGSLTFGTTASWYFDSDVSTTESFAGYDFYSVAIHEVAHILGIGTADSWMQYVSAGVFTGPNAVSSYGGNVPLQTGDGHWAEGTMSTVQGTGSPQEAGMDPSISANTRKVLTDLDWAALDDIGWDIAPVPEPSTYAMLGLGAAGLLFFRRKVKA